MVGQSDSFSRFTVLAVEARLGFLSVFHSFLMKVYTDEGAYIFMHVTNAHALVVVIVITILLRFLGIHKISSMVGNTFNTALVVL